MQPMAAAAGVAGMPGLPPGMPPPPGLAAGAGCLVQPQLPPGLPPGMHAGMPTGMPTAMAPGLAMAAGGMAAALPGAGLVAPTGMMPGMVMPTAMMGGFPAMLQPQMAAHMMQQACNNYEKEASQTLEPEVIEFQKHFKLDDRIIKDLDVQLKKRKTVEDDIKDLYAIIEEARNPAGLLRVKIKEMEEGIFRGAATPDKDVEDLAHKFKLDANASAKLAEVLARRPDRKRDLRQLTKHLELSNKTSSLVMIMLKDLRAGLPIKDPEYPAAVGSYRHKMGLRGHRRSRSRSRRARRRASESSSSPPPEAVRRQGGGSSAGSSGLAAGDQGGASGPRAMTLLERFG
eukprot:TRINITY_DN50062_c0_g1_i1.p1 TRINITY_DN50062_c0_g1~~TRINITY_DN50062_c0_g1_i1.p1  ORF type:complete len:373 (-),score=91.42 TRINITY_DN50062_c0_g1_i1:95-1126(-)